MFDFNVEIEKEHEEREREFGEKPFAFGYKPQEDGKPREPEIFYVRANVGYLGIKRVAALSEDSSGGETFDAIEESVFSMIDPRDNALERFRAVTRNNDFPITFNNLLSLQNWLIQEQTGRPPTQEQPSVATPTTSGEPSTATSSTRRGAASES